MIEGPQWLEERRKGIGGSDVAAILGLSPWKTPFAVYQEKRREVADWNGNEATDWGKRMEPAIRQWYSDTTGRIVRVPDKIMFHPVHTFMLASLDGLTDDERIVEIKTARSARGWGEPGTNEIPDYYLVQVMHYLAVTGFPVADLPVSIGGGSPELYEIPADNELIEMIIDAEGSFWRQVQDGIPPAPVTYADAVQRFGRSAAEGAVLASQQDIMDVSTLRTIQSTKKALEAREEEIKGRLIISLGEKGSTLVGPDDNPLITYKLGNGRGSFDHKALERDMPEIFRKYSKPGEPQRRFLTK